MLQSDQINMAVFFWYLVKSDAIVRNCTVANTEQVTFYKVSEKHDHVNLVTLYVVYICDKRKYIIMRGKNNSHG